MFSECEQVLSRIEMDRFSSLFKFKIPDSFMAHYLRYNGGYPEESKVRGTYNVFSINGFNPIAYGCNTIESMLMVFVGVVPGLTEDCIPFAYDDGGNTFFLSLMGNEEIFLMAVDGGERFHVIYGFEDFIKSME